MEHNQLHFNDISLQDFLKQYWQKKPVVLRQAIPNFNSPLSAEELAGLSLEAEVESRIVVENAHDSSSAKSADELNDNKDTYYGSENATTTAIADDPDGNKVIEAKITEKIDSIEDQEDKTNLEAVFGYLSKIIFKEKVLIYECLESGRFDFKKFMKLACSESDLSEVFRDIIIKAILNYGNESQKLAIKVFPGSKVIEYLRLEDLGRVAVVCKSGFFVAAHSDYKSSGAHALCGLKRSSSTAFPKVNNNECTKKTARISSTS